MKNVIGLVATYVFIAIVILSAKFFEKAGKEATRKYIHIMLSNWWFIAMYFFDNVIWASIGPVSFIIINYISYKKNLISVMERDSKEEDGLGTVYYAISLFLIAIYTFGVINRPEIGLCAVLIMGYGDGLAGIIGRSIKSYTYKIGNGEKTIAGSSTMLFISFLIVAIFLCYSNSTYWIAKAIIIGLFATIVEAVSWKGTDNLTVPVLTCLIISMIA